MQCFFAKQGDQCVCLNCGNALRINEAFPDCESYNATCRSEPRDPLTCLHFRGPTGDSTETHKHCGCKTATPLTALAACELHGTCTFIGRAKDERIPYCHDCQDYAPGK